ARGMSFPHRQELLIYQMNNSNFQKMIRMGMPGDPLCISVCWGDPADSQWIEKGVQSGHGRGCQGQPVSDGVMMAPVAGKAMVG
ncbi:hypothetical protein PAXRUDRAFT_164478, partial [Paxillus rubicundulus Ve08.2h10]